MERILAMSSDAFEVVGLVGPVGPFGRSDRSDEFCGL